MTRGRRGSVGLVWAEAADGVIGAEGGIPWHVPEDLAHFRDVTMGEPVVMGRRTWDSLPERFRPLPGRRNIVVTRQPTWQARGAERAGSLDDALAAAGEERVWVIGGGELFGEALADAETIELTEVDLVVAGDTFAPSREGFTAVSTDPSRGWHTSRTGVRYRFLRLERLEQQGD
jgi:dihydrofolate reductase